MVVLGHNLNELCAISDEQRVASEASEKAELLDVAVNAIHALLESPHSDDILNSIGNRLRREVTEDTIHAAGAVVSSMAQMERGIQASASRSLQHIREFGLPT